MRKTILLSALLALFGLYPRSVQSQAADKAPSTSVWPTTLSERHPATLSGRMDRKSRTYVDLYAPLSSAEARNLTEYRQAPTR